MGRRRGVISLGIVIILALSTLSFITTTRVYASPGIIYVGGSGPMNLSCIQCAIGSASPGDTVFVYSGIYYENIVISKDNINLIGEDKNTTILDGSGSGDVVRIYDCNSVLIKDFTVRNAVNGIKVYSDNDYNHNTISDCVVHSCLAIGMDIVAQQGEVLTDTKIVDCEIYDITNGYGIRVHGTDGPFDNHNNQIINTKIHNCQNGMTIGGWLYSQNNLITGCEIYDNTDTGLVAVPTYSKITENYIHDNHILGLCMSDSATNLLYHNNIANNGQNAHEAGSNIWYNATLQEGNYWSDFDEPSEGAWDNNSDGIVDTPYNIPGGGNRDLYPLIHPWGAIVTRSLSSCVDPMQETFIITINASNYGMFCEINETLPEGCEYVGSSLQEYQVFEWSHGVRFILVGETTFTYNVGTPTIAGEYIFYGRLRDMGLNAYIIGGDDTVIVWSPWIYDTMEPYGTITKPEVISAIQHYFHPTTYAITYQQVIDVIQIYFNP